MGRRTHRAWGRPAFVVMVLATESKGWVWMDPTLRLCLVLVGSGFQREELPGLHQQHQQQGQEKDGEEPDGKMSWNV